MDQRSLIGRRSFLKNSAGSALAAAAAPGAIAGAPVASQAAQTSGPQSTPLSNQPKVGLVTCVHPTYSLPAIMKHRDNAVEGLKKAGCEVISAEIPRTSTEAIEVASVLKRNEVDLVLMFFCTWMAEEIPLAIAREIGDTPLMMWALPYLDKDIPMPSPITGLTTTGCNVRRLGKPYSYMIGPVEPEQMQEAIRAANVAKAVRKVRRARYGVVGAQCPGMVDAGWDDAEMHKAVGSTAIHLDLDALLKASREASAAEASRVAKEFIARTGGTQGITEATVADNVRLYLGMKQLVEQNKLDAYCVRCWPELRDQYKTTMCLGHSLLTRDGVTNACEVDLPSLITNYLLNQLSGAAVHAFDITAYLKDQKAIQFAHCGAADLSLAADPKKARIRGHMRTGAGAMIEFGFKEGVVTVAKLLRPIDGRNKMFVCRAQAIASPDDIRGVSILVRPEPSVDAFIAKLLREGVEHHVSVVYGDYTRELAQFCEFTGIDLLTT